MNILTAPSVMGRTLTSMELLISALIASMNLTLQVQKQPLMP